MGGLFSSSTSSSSKTTKQPYGAATDLLTQLGQAVNPAISEIQGALSGLPGAISSAANPLGANLAAGLETPLDSNAVLQPIEESYNRTILPGIKSSAVSAGAPGGSREGDLMTQAAGQFGRDEASALANAQTQRLATIGQYSPVAEQLQTAGAQSGATTGVQSAMAPISLILQALSGYQPYIGSKTKSGTTSSPSVFSDIMGVTSYLQSLMESIGGGMAGYQGIGTGGASGLAGALMGL